jgi:Membrane proteins related to metalloendopeptidases
MCRQEQAKLYDFKKDAKAQVKELLSSDYDEMWNELIGNSGEIIISSSTHVPNFIFAWPLDGDYHISSQFGTRRDPITGVVKTHGGTDIAAAQGTPILAAADGVVEIAGFNAGGYGYYVKIAHGNGYETLYGHCSVLLVSTGQTVKQGQLIAKVGSTGHFDGATSAF